MGLQMHALLVSQDICLIKVIILAVLHVQQIAKNALMKISKINALFAQKATV